MGVSVKSKMFDKGKKEENKSAQIPSNRLLEKIGYRVAVSYSDSNEVGYVRRTQYGILLEVSAVFIVIKDNMENERYIKFEDVREIVITEDDNE